MYKIFKIAVYIILVLFMFDTQVVQAITVTNTSNPVISDTMVSQSVQIYFDGTNPAGTLTARVISPYIVNNDNPSVQIPISNLYLTTQGVSSQLAYNSDVVIYSDTITPSGSYLSSVWSIENIGLLPVGTYTAQIEFTNNYASLPVSSTYNLSFTVTPEFDVTTITQPATITLTTEEALDDSGALVNNDVDSQLDISANTNWQLILDTSNIGELQGNYYFQVLSSTGAVNGYTTTQTQLLPNQQYVLAQGTQTIENPPSSAVVPTNIIIRYMFTNSSGGYIGAGTFYNNLQYIMQQI